MKYRFYIAWLTESDGADGEETGVNSPDDLMREFHAGNENVSTYEFEADNDSQALDKGYAWAFHENFTAHDSVTEIERLEK